MSNIEGLLSAVGDEMSLLRGNRSTRVATQPSTGASVLSGTKSLTAVAPSGGAQTITISPGTLTADVLPGMILRVFSDFEVRSGTGATRDAVHLRLVELPGTSSATRLPLSAQGFISSFGGTNPQTIVATQTVFAEEMVGQYVTVFEAESLSNAGRFPIAAFVSPTTVTVTNPDAVAETPARPCRFIVEGAKPGDSFTSTTVTSPVPIAVVNETTVSPFVNGVVPPLAAPTDTVFETAEDMLAFDSEAWMVTTPFRDVVIESVTVPGTLVVRGEGLGGTLLSAASWEIFELPDNHIEVETTLDWPSSGEVFVDGTRYTYEGKTLTELHGLLWYNAGVDPAANIDADGLPRPAFPAAVLPREFGVRFAHPPLTEVVEGPANQFSGLDQTRAAKHVATATADDLDAIGQKLSVPRPTGMSNDDVFRAVIEAVAYAPRGTMCTLYDLLDAILGPDTYTIFEDLTLGSVHHANTVFFFRDFTTDPVGKTFVDGPETDVTSAADEITVAVSPTTLDFSSVRLAPEPANIQLAGMTNDTRTHQGSRLVAFGDDAVLTGNREVVITAPYEGHASILPGDVFEVLDGRYAGARASIVKTNFGGATKSFTLFPQDDTGVAELVGLPVYPWVDPIVAQGTRNLTIYTGDTDTAWVSREPIAPFGISASTRLYIFDENGDLFHTSLVSDRVSSQEMTLTTAAPSAISNATWMVRDADKGIVPLGPWKVWRAQGGVFSANSVDTHAPEDEETQEPAGTATATWAHTGTSAVSSLFGTGFTSFQPDTLAHSVVWEHEIRASAEREIRVDFTLGSSDVTAFVSDNVVVNVTDGTKIIKIVFSYSAPKVVPFIADGAGLPIGDGPYGAVGLTSNAFRHYTIIRDAYDETRGASQQRVRLYEDGKLIDLAAYSACSNDTAQPPTLWFASFADGVDAPDVWLQNIDWSVGDGVDYWAEATTTSTGGTTAPDNLDGLGTFTAGESVTVLRHGGLNASGGNAVGSWIGTGSGTNVIGETRDMGTFTLVDTRRFVVDTDEMPFVWPDMKGYSVEILDGDNAGTYPIVSFLDPVELTDMDFAPGTSTTLTMITERTSGSSTITSGDAEVMVAQRTNAVVLDTNTHPDGQFVGDASNCTWRLIPAFPTDATGVVFHRANAGTQFPNYVATTTAGTSLPYHPILVDFQRTLEYSAVTEQGVEVANDTPRTANARHPFYLFDAWGYLRPFIDKFLAAGVIPDYDSLQVDELGHHSIDET